MRVIIEKNYDELSRWAARHVVETIKAFHPTAEKPFVLGLPTGSSPMGMYAPSTWTNTWVFLSLTQRATIHLWLATSSTTSTALRRTSIS